MSKLPRRQRKYRLVMERARRHKYSFALYLVLRGVVILTMIAQFLNGNYENVFLCGLTLCLLILPSFIQYNFHIELPNLLEIIILLFIFAAEILGEIQNYYVLYPHWDTILHTINGFLAAAIGFSMVDLLNRNRRFTFALSPAFMALVAFCFSMTIGVLWEFFEFGMDRLFLLDMQKDTVVNVLSSVLLNPDGETIPVILRGVTQVTVNGTSLDLGGYLDIGLIDTMHDLFVNFIGAAVFSVFGYFYVKHRGKGKLLQSLIPRVRKEEHTTRVSER